MHNVSFDLSFWIIILLLVAGGFVNYVFGKLTLSGSITGVVISILIYLGAGLPGIIMLAAFFILGTAVTSFKKEYKLKADLAESYDTKRTMSQVIANGGVAALLAVLNIAIENPIILVMIAGSLASSTSDTFSSELGNIYGRNFYNILTLKKDKRGLHGVVSIEGTLFGILGCLVIASIYIAAFGWSLAFFAIAIAGIAGNLWDSFLGALFERKGLLGNDAVNFLNNIFAAVIALVLYVIGLNQ
jgi:uncharacterized protein (TIGR00297 family)